jgi:kynurenine formamidase
MFGVEAVSPGRPGRNNFAVHHVCRDLGFTHVEGLINLDQVVGKGRFKFIGSPNCLLYSSSRQYVSNCQ